MNAQDVMGGQTKRSGRSQGIEGRLLKRVHRLLDERWDRGDAFWRRVMNRPAAQAQRSAPLDVASPLAREVLAELNAEGIVAFPIGRLAGGDALFGRIAAQERRLVGAHGAEIEARRAAFTAGARGYKGFILPLDPADDAAVLPFDDACVQFALHPEILAVVNAFLGLYARLRRLEFWYTLASSGQTPTTSQLWHRDFEDMSLVKLFLYLSDVDETAGPFSFVRGTHRGRLRWRDPAAVAANRTNRATDEQMAEVIPRERWFAGTGASGTVILAATKGYHKGGLATGRDRRLLTAIYLSPWSTEAELAKPITGVSSSAHPAVRFAAQGADGSRGT